MGQHHTLKGFDDFEKLESTVPESTQVSASLANWILKIFHIYSLVKNLVTIVAFPTFKDDFYNNFESTIQKFDFQRCKSFSGQLGFENIFLYLFACKMYYYD